MCGPVCKSWQGACDLLKDFAGARILGVLVTRGVGRGMPVCAPDTARVAVCTCWLVASARGWPPVGVREAPGLGAAPALPTCGSTAPPGGSAPLPPLLKAPRDRKTRVCRVCERWQRALPRRLRRSAPDSLRQGSWVPPHPAPSARETVSGWRTEQSAPRSPGALIPRVARPSPAELRSAEGRAAQLRAGLLHTSRPPLPPPTLLRCAPRHAHRAPRLS